MGDMVKAPPKVEVNLIAPDNIGQIFSVSLRNTIDRMNKVNIMGEIQGVVTFNLFFFTFITFKSVFSNLYPHFMHKCYLDKFEIHYLFFYRFVLNKHFFFLWRN